MNETKGISNLGESKEEVQRDDGRAKVREEARMFCKKAAVKKERKRDVSSTIYREKSGKGTEEKSAARDNKRGKKNRRPESRVSKN